MEVNRGELPEKIEVDYSVKITRQELLDVLNLWVKAKVNSRAILEDIEIGGSADVESENTENTEMSNFKLDYVIASGIEVIPLNWKK